MHEIQTQPESVRSSAITVYVAVRWTEPCGIHTPQKHQVIETQENSDAYILYNSV